MRPYYEHDGITIYHGDCREVLPTLGQFDAVVTDPVWVNAAVEGLARDDDPVVLFAEAAAWAPKLAKRLVVQMGCDSDPRLLQGVPPEMPFLRGCWLEYAQPGYKGRLLHTGDIAYAFGTWPPARPGAHLIPGRFLDPSAGTPRLGHPCPRRLGHVKWLLNWFVELGGAVLDPFAGSGTTLVAAAEHSMRCTGIEIEERYCEIAAKRLAQGVLL